MQVAVDPHAPYVQSDLNHVHTPALHHVRRIKNDGPVVCQCCITEIDSDDLTMKVFRYETDTCISIAHKVKTVYCSSCVQHIGIVTCPSIRGVASYKTVDPAIVARILSK